MTAPSRAPFLDRWSGMLAALAIFAAGVAAAFRTSYAGVVLLAAAGLALLAWAAASTRRRTRRALRAASGAFGSPVVEERHEDGAPWFAERGFADYAGQRVRRLRVRSVDSADGSVAAVEAFLGSVRSLWRAFVLTTPVRTPGRASVYAGIDPERRRARRLGGAVDVADLADRFVVFAADPESAAALVAAIDPDAVDALFVRLRGPGRRPSPGLAFDGARATVLLERGPPEAIDPAAARETFALLRRCIRS